MLEYEVVVAEVRRNHTQEEDRIGKQLAFVFHTRDCLAVQRQIDARPAANAGREQPMAGIPALSLVVDVGGERDEGRERHPSRHGFLLVTDLENEGFLQVRRRYLDAPPQAIVLEASLWLGVEVQSFPLPLEAAHHLFLPTPV